MISCQLISLVLDTDLPHDMAQAPGLDGYAKPRSMACLHQVLFATTGILRLDNFLKNDQPASWQCRVSKDLASLQPPRFTIVSGRMATDQTPGRGHLCSTPLVRYDNHGPLLQEDSFSPWTCEWSRYSCSSPPDHLHVIHSLPTDNLESTLAKVRSPSLQVLAGVLALLDRNPSFGWIDT